MARPPEREAPKAEAQRHEAQASVHAEAQTRSEARQERREERRDERHEEHQHEHHHAQHAERFRRLAHEMMEVLAELRAGPYNALIMAGSNHITDGISEVERAFATTP